MRVLLFGYGFMGRTHAGVIRRLRGVELAGIMDPRGAELAAQLQEDGLGGVPVFLSVSEALEGCESDAVDICLPTDLHREAMELSLAAGRHVFCEKPIALRREDGLAMVQAAQAVGRQFMVGQCLRFWPEYLALAEAVHSGDYGVLRSLSLSRRSEIPEYSVGDWVKKTERCVGAALDLHIHDTDIICSMLGVPQSVVSRGLRESTGWNSIVTAYDYGMDGPLVYADGAWNYPAGWGFQMRFSAVFEKAALDFDSRASRTLLRTLRGESPGEFPLPGSGKDAYFAELEYFFDCLREERPVEVSSGIQALESLEVVLSEIQSAHAGGERTSPVISQTNTQKK